MTFLWRAAGSPKPETRTMPFTDVPAGSYYYDAVLWAVENDITKHQRHHVQPQHDLHPRPDRRLPVAFREVPGSGYGQSLCRCEVRRYYADAVLWAVKENITKGTTNTTFSPDADCTRAQIVTFLWRCKK